MRLAHVRERHAPAGTPFRLAAALGHPTETWLDLEPARRRLAAGDPRLAHNDPLFRLPATTLDAHLAAGHRVADLGRVVEPFAAAAEVDEALTLETADLTFGPPILRPPSFRDFYAFEGHVSTVWARRDQPVPEAWYRLPIFYFSNVSEIRGPGDPVWAPDGSVELDYELEIGALVDAPMRDLPPETAEDAIGGYFVLNDWSARDLQRDETTVRLGPAKGKDFATTIGPWLVTPDELASARAGQGYELAMAAEVNGAAISRGRWSDIHHGFGAMLARASADVHLRAGDLIGSGTVGSGCLLEVGDRLGRWLQPGDLVSLEIERLGRLETPIVAGPAARPMAAG